MIFTLRLLGIEVLHLELSQPEPETSTDDPGWALSGGTTASMPINLAWRPGEDSMARPEWPYED